MIVDVLVSRNVDVGRLLFATLTATHHEHTDGHESGELNDDEREHNARDVQELLAYEMLEFGETAGHEIVVGGHGLRRAAGAVVSGHGGESAGCDAMQSWRETTQRRDRRDSSYASSSDSRLIDEVVVVVVVDARQHVADTTRGRHDSVVETIGRVLVPPAVRLPVAEVVLTAAVQLVLQIVEVLGERDGVFFAVRVEYFVEQRLDVLVHVVAVQEDEHHGRDLEAQESCQQEEELFK